VRTVLPTLAAAACASGLPAGSVSDRDLRGAVPAPREAHDARVVRVVDGDTLVLAGVGLSRLVGVDAPEVRGRGECYADEASAFARRTLAPGRRVRYLLDEDPRDRYGRALVYLWLPDGRSFNAMLLEGGHATVLTIPPNDRYARRFQALEREAKKARRGRWNPSICAGRA
jgi:micrococcal nuclease